MTIIIILVDPAIHLYVKFIEHYLSQDRHCDIYDIYIRAFNISFLYDKDRNKNFDHKINIISI